MTQLAFNLGEAFLLKEGGTAVKDSFDSPATLISLIVNNLYVIAGIILFFFVIAGGLGILLNPSNADKAKQGAKTITTAIIGFAILFSSYWIIRIIEAITGINILGN
jgi:type IV secretion system pilin